MTRRRTDWALDEARRCYDLMSGGCSREVAVTYLAQVFRLASQRGAIVEGAKAKAAKETLI